MAPHEPASPQAHSGTMGIEIADGATRLTAILDDEPSPRRWHIRLPTPPSPEEAVSHIHELIERAMREVSAQGVSAATVSPPPIAAIGIALWGRVDASSGVVQELRPIADWQGFPLARVVSERWHLPVAIAPAVVAAALAEARHSANAAVETQFYAHVGRTISSACIRNGSAILGLRDGEGMLAHMHVYPNGVRCSCGLQGHLEPIASAQAIVRNMIGLASDSEESTAAMLHISHGRAEAMSAVQVIRLAAEGEPVAARVVGSAFDALALALANATTLLAPDAIVIGGPLTEAGDAIVTPVRDRLERLCRPFTTPPALHLGTREPYSALLGAQLLAHTWHNT